MKDFCERLCDAWIDQDPGHRRIMTFSVFGCTVWTFFDERECVSGSFALHPIERYPGHTCYSVWNIRFNNMVRDMIEFVEATKWAGTGI